jgi:glycosyltransferase involved in cell wall biosynthesis
MMSARGDGMTNNCSVGEPGLVSIVIPCYGGARFLTAAIESCLGQTDRHLEVIVVDDASPDDCADIATRYAERDARVRLIRHTRNGGVSRAFNTGFAAARGEFFTRLAQDDVFHPGAIAGLKRELLSNTHAGLVYCDMILIDASGAVIGYKAVSNETVACREGESPGLCLMWRRSVWNLIGAFDPDFDTADDREFFLRLAKKFKFKKLAGEAMFSQRIHGDMGSIVESPRQELALMRAHARHCNSIVQAWRFCAAGHYECAYAYRERRQFGMAFYHLMCALARWPFSGRYYRCLAGLARDYATSMGRASSS